MVVGRKKEGCVKRYLSVIKQPTIQPRRIIRVIKLSAFKKTIILIIKINKK